MFDPQPRECTFFECNLHVMNAGHLLLSVKDLQGKPIWKIQNVSIHFNWDPVDLGQLAILIMTTRNSMMIL